MWSWRTSTPASSCRSNIRGWIAPDEVVPVDRLEQERATRPERPRHGSDHARVFRVVLEVAEGREDVDYRVELGLERDLAHVRVDPADLDAVRTRVVPRTLEEHVAEVEPRDPHAARGEPDGVSTVSAREVEHPRTRFETEEVDQEIHLPFAHRVVKTGPSWRR